MKSYVVTYKCPMWHTMSTTYRDCERSFVEAIADRDCGAPELRGPYGVISKHRAGEARCRECGSSQLTWTLATRFE